MNNQLNNHGYKCNQCCYSTGRQTTDRSIISFCMMNYFRMSRHKKNDFILFYKIYYKKDLHLNIEL